MSKQIVFTYNDKEYTLEFTPKSIKTMERQGFTTDALEEKPMNVFPDLFAGAFLANHSSVRREKINEIFEQMNGKKKLLPALVAMYNDVVSAYLLGDDEEDEGNANWTPNWEIEKD